MYTCDHITTGVITAGFIALRAIASGRLAIVLSATAWECVQAMRLFCTAATLIGRFASFYLVGFGDGLAAAGPRVVGDVFFWSNSFFSCSSTGPSSR